MEFSPSEIRRTIECERAEAYEWDDGQRIYRTVRLAACLEKIGLGKHSFIGDFVLIAVGRLSLGDGAQINANTTITGGKGTVWIGKNSVVSYGVRIMTRTDTPSGNRMNDASPESERAIKVGDVYIGDDCFIGAGAILCPSVTVGNGSVIGANVYLDSDVAENMVVTPEQRLIFKERKRRA